MLTSCCVTFVFSGYIYKYKCRKNRRTKVHRLSGSPNSSARTSSCTKIYTLGQRKYAVPQSETVDKADSSLKILFDSYTTNHTRDSHPLIMYLEFVLASLLATSPIISAAPQGSWSIGYSECVATAGCSWGWGDGAYHCVCIDDPQWQSNAP